MIKPINLEEKNDLNKIITKYKKAIAEKNIEYMNEINFLVVHNQRYSVVSEWLKLMIDLNKKWTANQKNTKTYQTYAIQLKFLLEKIEIYKSFLDKIPSEEMNKIVLTLEQEINFRKAAWQKDEKEFQAQIKNWRSGKLNCPQHAKLKSLNSSCKNCITDFDLVIKKNIDNIKDQINYLEINNTNQYDTKSILRQLVNSHNNLIDMHKLNYEIIEKKSN